MRFLDVKDTIIRKATGTPLAVIADTAVVLLPDTADKLNALILLLKANGIIL